MITILLKLLHDILARDPDNAQALSLSGSILLKNHNLELALPILTRIVEISPSVEGYNNIAETLLRLGRSGDCLQVILQSLRLDPHHSGTLMLMSRMHAQSKEIRKAKILRLRALQLGAFDFKEENDTRQVTAEKLSYRQKNSA